MNSVIPSNIGELIRAISVYSLPTRPSDKGYSPDQIKKAMYQPSVELATYLLSLDNYMNKMNGIPKVYPSLPTSDLANFEDGTLLFVAGEDLTAYVVEDGVATKIGYSFSEFVSHVTALEGYFTNGKANNAIADEDGNDIVSTYETKSHSASEIDKLKDGTYAAKKAEQDASGNTITSTYATKAEEIVNNATAKQEAIESAATTAQTKVDALASAMDFSNGTFGTIDADQLNVRQFVAETTESFSSAIENHYFEFMKGNVSDLSANYAGSAFVKYNSEDDFFYGLHGHEFVFGKCEVERDSDGNIEDIENVSLIPAMGRAATSALQDGHLLKWNAADKKAEDAEIDAAGLAAAEQVRTSNESARVLAEQGRVSAEQARVTAETERALQEKYRVINHPYAITQAEYNTLMNGGVFGVHLSTPLVEGDDPELICTVYASEALAEEAEETYIFPMQDNIEYPAKGISGDSPYLNIPTPPQADGNYVLKCSVVNGAVTYTWEAQQ